MISFQNAAALKRDCFTLIELLVVIAIIAILAALLLPSLKKARDRVNETVCQSQLKQIGVGMVCYSNDNDGFIPPHYMSKAGVIGGYWTDFLCPYIMNRAAKAENSYYYDSHYLLWGEESPFMCPVPKVRSIYVDDYNDKVANSWGGKKRVRFSYGSTLGGTSDTRKANWAGMVEFRGAGNPPSPYGACLPANLMKKDPGSALLYCACLSTVGGAEYYTLPTYWTPTSTMINTNHKSIPLLFADMHVNGYPVTSNFSSISSKYWTPE